MAELRAGVYKHYKGLLVAVLGVARHSETDEQFVAYVPLGVKEGARITVRPYDMFFDKVDGQPRFEFVGETVDKKLAKDYTPDSKKENSGQYDC